MNQLENHYQEFLNYLASEKNASPSTLTSYNTDFKIFLDFLSLIQVEPTFQTVDTVIIRRYISFLQKEKKFAVSTLRRKIHSLSSYFKFLVEQEYIIKNPMLPIHAPKKPTLIPIYIKQNEVERLLECPENHSGDVSHRLRDKVMLELFVFTGARRGEVLGLDWNDIDFGQNTITIKKGKGRKQRLIPLIEPLLSDLWEYLQTRLPLTTSAVILSDNGTRMSPSNLNALFRRYLKKAHIDNKGYTIHKCRHTFASLLHQNDVDLLYIQELLGHEDLNSTKIYTHTSVNHLRKQIEKFPIKINSN